MHQRKVAQIRQILLISAWERWRERFREERLRPLVCFLPPYFFLVDVELFHKEYQLIIDHQKHISKYSFDIWVSKTDVGI
jgi:protein SFI1